MQPVVDIYQNVYFNQKKIQNTVITVLILFALCHLFILKENLLSTCHFFFFFIFTGLRFFSFFIFSSLNKIKTTPFEERTKS